MKTRELNKIRTRYNEIWLDEEGILWLKASEGAEIDLEETKACFTAYAQLGCKPEKTVQLYWPRILCPLLPKPGNMLR